MRKISEIIPAERINMGGIFLYQALPAGGLDQLDPFLLIHHWYEKYPGAQRQEDIGVGPHPHRGFSPVTVIYKGAVHHRDSEGNDSIVYKGGVQWMNSGSGLVHSERPEKSIAEKGGEFEIIQFWVNSPAKAKMNKPHYFALQQSDLIAINSPDGRVRMSLIAGEFEGYHSNPEPLSPMCILNIEMDAGSSRNIPIPPDFNSLLYLLDGNINCNGQNISNNKTTVIFEKSPGEISIRSHENSRLLLLSAEPIKETVSSYGPFVMNNQRELMNAIQDYQAGKMGELIESFD